MIMKKLILFIFAAIMATSAQAQTAVDAIRKHYDAMKSQIAEMGNYEGEYPVPTYYHVQIKENYPGTGPHFENIYIYHDEVESAEDVIFPPKRIEFVTTSYNFAARQYYEEYLFDKKGNLEFLYARSVMEDDYDREYRLYLRGGKAVKAIVKERPVSSDENASFKTVYEGASIPKQYNRSFQGYIGKSKRFKALFSAVADVQCYWGLQASVVHLFFL